MEVGSTEWKGAVDDEYERIISAAASAAVAPPRRASGTDDAAKEDEEEEEQDLQQAQGRGAFRVHRRAGDNEGRRGRHHRHVSSQGGRREALDGAEGRSRGERTIRHEERGVSALFLN